jgi:hypothetical protein
MPRCSYIKYLLFESIYLASNINKFYCHILKAVITSGVLMKKFALIISLFIACCNALAADDLTQEALRTGHAFGPVPDEQAIKIREQTKSNGPITMDIKVIHRYAQESCARLNYLLMQPNVRKKNGKMSDLRFQWQMNICSNGMPPKKPLVIKK